MRRIQKMAYALGGFVLGVLFTSAVWLWAESRPDYISAASAEKSEREINAMTSEEKTTASEDNGGQREDPVPLPAADSWAAAAVYIGGDTVSFQGRRYRAKWWTQGEQPDSSDVWEDLGILEGEPTQPEGVDNRPVDASVPQDTELTDFINIMAYDGGDGERHSQYQFAVDCGTYWKETRGLPAHKIVLGVPFYARPSWEGYGTILESIPDACDKDHVAYNGMEVYYNGVSTITEKTLYAKENLGGIMIWELTQDSMDNDKSLLQAIGKAADLSEINPR